MAVVAVRLKLLSKQDIGLRSRTLSNRRIRKRTKEIHKRVFLGEDMRIFLFFLVSVISSVTHSSDFYDDYNTESDFGSDYDYRSGNSYHWQRNSDGSTDVNGINYNSGKTWQTTIEEDGDMHGRDGDFNYWRYNEDTNTYINFGTGEICTGTGYARTCY